jgi:hypothetical protein
MTQKFLYIVDHFVGFPSSEYGGIWNVIAENDDECFDLISSQDNDDNVLAYSKLRENIMNSSRFELTNSHQISRVVENFIT